MNANEAHAFIGTWMDRWFSRDERWRWINHLDGVEYYGLNDDNEPTWFCGVKQGPDGDVYITAMGETPDTAMIALAAAIQEYEQNNP